MVREAIVTLVTGEAGEGAEGGVAPSPLNPGPGLGQRS
jgi:hypothetical protein